MTQPGAFPTIRKNHAIQAIFSTDHLLPKIAQNILLKKESTERLPFIGVPTSQVGTLTIASILRELHPMIFNPNSIHIF